MNRKLASPCCTPLRAAARWIVVGALVVSVAGCGGCGGCQGQASLTRHTPAVTRTGQHEQPNAAAPMNQPRFDRQRGENDPVVAEVAGESIRRSQLEQAFQGALQLRAHTGRATTATWKHNKRRQLLNEAVEDRLLRRAVVDHGVEVSSEEVDAQLQHKIETTFKTRAALERYLSKLNLSEWDYREQLRHELALGKLLAAQGDHLEIKPEQIRAWYDQHPEQFQARERVHLASILIKTPRGADEEGVKALRDRAQALYQLTRKRGQTFQDLARRYSEGVGASEGGDMGWNYRHTLSPSIAVKAFTLPVGAVSEPIRTRMGFQLIKVLDRRRAGVRAFDEVKTSIHEQLEYNARRQARGKLLAQLKTLYPTTLHNTNP